MKKLVLATLLGAAALQTGVTEGASTSGTFNVTITLTSTCTMSAVSPVDFAYTSFQGSAQNSTGGGYTITCTNSLPYTFGLQAGTAAPTPPGTATINVTDNAVNLAYQLGTSAVGGTGNGAAQSYNVTGTMASGQSGSCATASCANTAATNKTQTLILNY